MIMNRNTLSFLGLTICTIAIISSIILFFVTEGTDAWKMKIAYIGFVVFMLHSCYRIWRFRSRTSKKDEGNEMQQKLRQVYSASAVSKGMLLFSYFRYWKVFQTYVDLEMNAD